MRKLSLPSAVIQQGSPVYFFGCGPLLEVCFEEICEMVGSLPDGLIDSDPMKIGQQILGYRCESPLVLARHERPVVVVTARNHWLIEKAVQAVNSNAQLLHVVFQAAFHKAVRVSAGPAVWTTETESQLPSEFRGGRAVVTGATRGIGKLLATRLAAQGFDLVIGGRGEALLREVAAELLAYGVEVEVVRADLGHEKGLYAFLEHPAVANRPCDLVFNNAGVASPDRAILDEPISMREMLAVYAVNVIAPIAIAEHFLRLSKKSRPVRIVFLTSNLSSPTNTTYTVTKTALNKYVHDSREVYERQGAALYLLDPGDVRTPMNPSGTSELESIFPAASLPVYCQGLSAAGVIHASEFSKMSIEQAVNALVTKYRTEWIISPIVYR